MKQVFLLLLAGAALGGCQLFSPSGEDEAVYCLTVVLPPPTIVVVDEAGQPAANVQLDVVRRTTGKSIVCPDGPRLGCVVPGNGMGAWGEVTGRYAVAYQDLVSRMGERFDVKAVLDGLQASATLTLRDTGCSVEKTAGPDTLRLAR